MAADTHPLTPPATLLAALLLLTSQALDAAPRDYRIDPVHSRILFAVDHYDFSRALGTLSGPTGWLRFDPEDWQSASVEVSIPLERLDLGDPKWNQRMLKRDFLDAIAHPVAQFRSTRVEPIDAERARIVGTLSLRGEQAEVVLDARLNRLARHPLTLRRTAGFSATATLSRSAFGMRSWASAVGDSVVLTIEVEATRARRNAAERVEASATSEPEAAEHAVAQ